MIKDIKELNFPAYATLETATATISDMGDRTITSQVKIDGDVVPDFSYDWEVEFKGERYIHPVKTPQGTKDNTSRKAKVDLVFQHWAIYEMKRQYFVEMASTTAGTAIADKYIASLGLNLGDFVTAFNLVLNHYFGGRIIIKLNPEWQYDTEAKFVSISYSYIWDVLQQMHEIYGVRWTLKTNADGVCEILMGYPAQEVSHIFEYGFEGGLLSVQRQVQSTDIRNRLLGRGGSKNLPYRYFKDKDPNNPLFEADPDWIPELANITFTELRGKTFRDYVKGWKAKRYGGTPMTEPTEAYLAGYNAEKFDPIEYVDDKESIEKYGVIVGALENNEEIYPSIQGAPGDVDMIVDAEQVTDDDVDAAVENDSVTTNLESGHQTYRNAPANSTITIETLTKRYFTIPTGKVGNLDMSLTVTGKYSNVGDYEPTYPILKDGTVRVTIYNKNTDAIIKSSDAPVVNIPAGDYYYMISVDVETNYDKTSMVTLNIESVHLYTSTPDESEGWRPTFDIWVRNIWGSSRNAGETDQQYADRVWLPILGDRMGDEARVVFASGWLSFSSDWEFPIVGYAFDDSKPGSEWRLTLAKSEAELEASGKYIPYEGYNASAGDRFFFIGIDMTHQYVLWGEERVDDYKRDRLPETARINPSWVIKADKVRLNQNREGAKLIDSLSAGAQIRLASKQFISGAYESLYVQSMTYNWTSDTILYPDVEVVVSDKVHTVKNPVAQIQGNIETLQRQVGSLSNIQQIIRQVCDQLYLRKDGVEDLSKSPTRFLGKVTGEKFRQGQIGGRDWGIYRDENGNTILEADKLVARQGILVADLVVNEATYVGGLQIRSAAHMDVTSVEDTEAGYVCSFDQKQGSVTNRFTEDDVVLCQKFDADQSEVKFYKRRVVSVSEASVTLSKTDVNGTGVPAEGDVIIHYGNYTDKSRQFVIISDVIGGGYERMLMGLDSVASDGVEYYFAGKSADSKARWFVGDAEQYAKYEDGQLTIKGNLFVTGGDKPINELIKYITDALGSGDQGLILGTAIIVGYNDDEGNFIPMAGLSGKFNKDQENGGPAAWYGGTPEDAMSMIFMDGTGYFAGGLFKWDKDKGINLGNGQLEINYDGSVDFGENIKIGTSEETLGTILTFMAKFNNMFYLTEDGQSIGTALNFFSEKEISANGLHVGSGGGGGTGGSSTLAGLMDVTLSSPVNGNILVYNGTHWVNKPQSELVPDIDLSDYYTKSEVDAKISDIDLSGYYTKDEIDAKGYVTATDLFPYAKLSDLDDYTKQTDFNALKQSYEALESALNDDVSGKINTWNEIVNFLDEYSGSEDLETILVRMEADTKSRLLTSTFNSFLSGDFAQLEEDVREMRDKDDELAGDIASNLSAITTLQGYFTNGVANRAIADANGNTIGSYYTPIATYNAFVTAYNQKVQSYDKMFGDLQDKDEDLMSDIDGLQTLTSSHTTQISGLVTRMGAAETRISNNSDAVQEAVGLVTILRSEYDLFEQSVEDRIRDMQEVDDGYNGKITANTADITALKARKITAGTGITGGGTLAADITLNIASANDGITVNADNIQLNTIDNLTTTSATKPLSASQGKELNERLAVIESMFTFDGDNIKTTYNLYSTKEISANGLGQGTGGSGGGLIKSVFGVSALGTSLSADNTVVFNAHATNKVYADLMTLKGRVDNLDITSTSVSWDDTITSGKKIGTLTIDRLENILYAPASYSWEDISGKTSAKLISVLGYTPYNAANFTKANIKSTLGISDWALASTKPSYTTSEVTEGTRQYFTNARAIAAVLGSSAIGSTTAYPYWTGSAWATKTLPTKLSDFTDDVVAGKYLSLATGGTVKGDIYSTGKLSADGTGYYGSNITTNGYLSFGTVGKNIGSTDPTSSFRQTIFGDTTNGSRLRTFRSTANVGQFSSSYASGLAWATSDSHAYIAISPYASVKSIHVGGGDAGVIDWSAQLFHNQLNIIPGTSATYNIGSSSYKWKDMYLSGTAYVGSVQANGEVSANILNSSSDIRFKNRINDLSLDLDTMANAPMFRFTWTNREDGRVQIGTSAQYWKGTEAKELVSIDDSDFHRLDYATLGVLIGVSLAKKTKNHEDRIKDLEMKVESLEKENRRLRYGN